MDVQFDFWKDKLSVFLDDGSEPELYDMVWLATGFENQLDNYSFLDKIRRELPIETEQGLPALSKDLTWVSPSIVPDDTNGGESLWKSTVRNRLWMMGPLAGLELGPDALNLMGARHGAVRIAKALRADIDLSASQANQEPTDEEADQ